MKVLKYSLKLLPIIALTIVLSGCVKDDSGLCGELINDRTINTIPLIDYFQIISYNTVSQTVKIRYTSDKFEKVCTKKDVNARLNIKGLYNNVYAQIWWANNKYSDIFLSYSPSVTAWTGISEWVNLADEYVDGPGRFWITIDFTFQFIGSNVDINNVYEQLKPLFISIYIDPDAYKSLE